MLATRLTEQQALSIRRTHSASIPAYLMSDDGSVIRIWPSGHVETIVTRRSKSVCRFLERDKSGLGCKRQTD